MITAEQFVSSPLGERTVDEIQRWVVLSLSDDLKDWREMDENFRDYLDEVPKLLDRMSEGILWEIVVEEAINLDGGVLCDCPNHECVEFFSLDMRRDDWSKSWELDVADAILSSKASSWWSDSWDKRNQVCLVEGAPTGPGEFKPRNMSLTPDEVNLWTSSALQDRASTEEGYVSADGLRSLFGDYFDTWRYYRVEMEPSKPVYEIDCQADLAKLCEFAPLTMPKYQYAGYVEPDWARVAEKWSGVHVTVNGLISCLNVEIPTSAGLAIMAHWIEERTAWFEWAVTGFERLPDLPGSTRMPRSPVPPRLEEITGRVPLASMQRRIPSPPTLNDLPGTLPNESGYGPVN